MIVISAAAGAFGRLVIERLLTRMPAGEVVAAVRDPVRGADLAALGVDVRHGDYAAHHATERAIIDSGLGYTMLRHPFYSEAFIGTGLRDAVESGDLVSGTGGRGLNTALRADLAEAAANVLTEDAHLGRGYDLTGPLWTYPQLAEALGEATGKKIEYREDADGPSGPMGFLMGLARSGALERQTDDLRRVLGRAPTSLRQAVASALGQG